MKNEENLTTPDWTKNQKKGYVGLSKQEFLRRLSVTSFDSQEENKPLLPKEESYHSLNASILRSPIVDEAQEEEMIKFIRFTIAGFLLLIFWCFGRYNDNENWVGKNLKFFSR